MNNKKTAFDYVNYFILFCIGLIMLYPFLYVLSVSLSDSASVMSGSITFYPKNITLKAYREVMGQEQFWVGYKNTLYYTLTSSVLGLFMTVIAAYPLSKKYLPGRAVIMKLFTVTMFFSALLFFFIILIFLYVQCGIWRVTFHIYA